MKSQMKGRWLSNVGIALLALASFGCEQQEALDQFIRQNMLADHCVNWADEGRIFVLHNGCYDLATEADYRTSMEYLTCTLADDAMAPPWPRTDEADVEVEDFAPGQWREALPWVERYRWITVNPSFSSARAAVGMAATQLKVMHRPGVVLVYLPQGPDATRVNFRNWDSREAEAKRYICGGYRIDHAAFRSSLGSLVEELTTRAVEAGRAATPLVVTAYSYSGPPTLEVVRDNPHVFFVNVAPNFGWAQWRGREDHSLPAGGRCIPTGRVSSYHELRYANGRVRQYILNQAFARVPQCLVASREDGITIGFRGFAVNMWEAEAARFNDPEGLRPTTELAHYDPYEPRTFWRHDFCVNAEPGYPGLKEYTGPDSLAAGGDPFNDAHWRWPTEGGREQTESCSCMAANLITNRENDLPSGYLLPRAFQANAHTVQTLRFVEPRTPSAAEDLSYGHALTGHFGENAYHGHFAYWMNGNLPTGGGDPDGSVPPEYATANLNFREVLQECVEQFEGSGSPAVAAAAEWAYGRSRCCCPGAGTFWP